MGLAASRWGRAQLSRATRHWVEAGIISSDQAAEILSIEGAAGEADGAEVRAAGGRLPLVAELVSYLGVVVVTVSGGLLVARFWGDLHFAGQLLVGVAVAALGLLTGTVVTRVGDAGAHRLGSFLSLCGTGGVAMAAAVAGDAVGDHDAGVTMLVTGLAVVAVSIPLWRNRDRPLPFLSTLAGVAVTAAGLAVASDVHVSALTTGILLCCAGVCFGALGAFELLHPSLLVLIVGELGAFAGALAITNSYPSEYKGLGLAIGMATAAVAVGVGLGLNRTAVTVVGILGFLGFLGGVLTVYLRGPVAAFGVFVIGVVLVIATIRFVVRRSPGAPREAGPSDESAEPPPRSTPTGESGTPAAPDSAGTERPAGPGRGRSAAA